MLSEWQIELLERRCLRCRRFYAAEKADAERCPLCDRDDAIRSRDRMARYHEEANAAIRELARSNAALRGVIARIKGRE